MKVYQQAPGGGGESRPPGTPGQSPACLKLPVSPLTLFLRISDPPASCFVVRLFEFNYLCIPVNLLMGFSLTELKPEHLFTSFYVVFPEKKACGMFLYLE